MQIDYENALAKIIKNATNSGAITPTDLSNKGGISKIINDTIKENPKLAQYISGIGFELKGAKTVTELEPKIQEAFASLMTESMGLTTAAERKSALEKELFNI